MQQPSQAVKGGPDHVLVAQPSTGGKGRGVERETETDKEQPRIAFDNRPLVDDSVVIYHFQHSEGSGSISKPDPPRSCSDMPLGYARPAASLLPSDPLPMEPLPDDISKEPRGTILFRQKVHS